MIIIVTASAIAHNILEKIKESYSVIEFDKRFHLNKNIKQLGKAEVLIVNLDLSSLWSNKNNLALKWLLKNDLDKFTVAWVYKRSKYKKLFNKYRYEMRNMPIVIGRQLRASLEIANDIVDVGSKSQSLTQEQIRDIMGHELAEAKIENSPSVNIRKLNNDGVSSTKVDIVQIVSKMKDEHETLVLENKNLKKQIEELKNKIHSNVPEPEPEPKPPIIEPPILKRQINKVVVVAKKRVEVKGNNVLVFEGTKVIKKIPFKSIGGKVKALKEARKLL